MTRRDLKDAGRCLRSFEERERVLAERRAAGPAARDDAHAWRAVCPRCRQTVLLELDLHEGELAA